MRVHGTSGTTGDPTIFGISDDDWERIAEAHARILWSVGLRPEDMVIRDVGI
jgi:phenylacetate-CoA ligase